VKPSLSRGLRPPTGVALLESTKACRKKEATRGHLGPRKKKRLGSYGRNDTAEGCARSAPVTPSEQTESGAGKFLIKNFKKNWESLRVPPYIYKQVSCAGRHPVPPWASPDRGLIF
jgi:hypothetical protein